MRRNITGFLLLLFVLATSLLFSQLMFAQVRDRIAQPIASGGGMRLQGNVHPLARPENDLGQVAADKMLYRITINFDRTAAQQADLDALLSEQQNPLSPYYHQWLTPEQFADRFGMSTNDIAKVTDWLQSQGFKVDETARSRTYVAFSGTAAQVESAFGTTIHRYEVNGEPHNANAADPVLPWPLANVVTGIRGLNDFRPRPHVRLRPHFTSSISGNHFLAPDDFATIYDLKALYNSGIDGTGQNLAVMGQTDLILSDIATFRSVSGLPANMPTVILIPGSSDPGVLGGDIDEANLDVQWSGAVARNATIIYVNSTNVFNSMGYAISQNLAPVITISYGDCEPNFSTSEINTLQSWGQQANAQGQTIMSATGDSGAADCDFPSGTKQLTSATHGLAVDVPAALPYVTGVSGTTFNEGTGTFWSATNNANNGSALSYIPETAWNDTAFEIANGGSIAATGGGVSTLFAKPVWQTGAGVPNDGKRDVPDISFSASFDHDGYLVCSQGSCVNGYRAADNTLTVVGGTSAGAPVFAGVVTLINQLLGAAQGNVNPRLYQLAGTSTDAFHDVTTGDNKIPCTAGSTGCPNGTTSIGFTAGPGYDLVTGLGSADASHLVNEWSAAAPSADFRVSLSTLSMSLTGVSSGNVGTSTLTLFPRNGFTGSVAFTCSVPSSLPGVTCTVSPNALTTSGTATAIITASASSVGSSGVVTITSVAGAITRTATVTVAVPPPDFQVTASPGSLTLTAGSTSNVGTSTVTVTAQNGFTGSVGFTCAVPTSLPGTTCTVSPTSLTTSGTVTVTVKAPTTRTVDLRPPKLFPHFLPWTDGTFAIAMGLMIVGKRERGSKKSRLAMLALFVVIAIAMMVGCGGGGSSSTAQTTTQPSTGTSVVGTGNVTVTATSGALTHTTNISVTVN